MFFNLFATLSEHLYTFRAAIAQRLSTKLLGGPSVASIYKDVLSTWMPMCLAFAPTLRSSTTFGKIWFLINLFGSLVMMILLIGSMCLSFVMAIIAVVASGLFEMLKERLYTN